jgi:hypothetical protein
LLPSDGARLNRHSLDSRGFNLILLPFRSPDKAKPVRSEAARRIFSRRDQSLISPTTVLAAVLIIKTVPGFKLIVVALTCLPSGVTATATGIAPTVTVAATELLAVSITEILLESGIRDIGEGLRFRRESRQDEPPSPAWRRGP